MIVCKNATDLTNYISNKKILIYGIGYVAHNFLKALQKQRLDKYIQGFVISKKNVERDEIEGFPLKDIDEVFVNDETIICIAVHEAVKIEIESVIVQKGYLNYIWIYPYLYDLYYGNPIREEWIDIRKLISRDMEKYAVALRWAAIEDYYGKCLKGFYLYQKGINLHASTDTAELRVKNFRKLIQSWDDFGYDPEKLIAINENYEIIDGEHRVVVGFYHGQKQMRCKIYHGESFHNEGVSMTKKALIEGGFTKKEMDVLDNINLIIRDLIL